MYVHHMPLFNALLFLTLCHPILCSVLEPKPVVTVGRFQVSPTKEIPPHSSRAAQSLDTTPAPPPAASPDMPTIHSVCSSDDNPTMGQTGLERKEISCLNATFPQRLHTDSPQAQNLSSNATHDQSQSLGLEQRLTPEAPDDAFCLHEQSQQDSEMTWTDETKEEEKREAQQSGDKEPDEDDKAQEEQQKKKKARRLGSIQSLTGTSVDSGLCVIMDPDGSLGDGIMDSPLCPVPHHSMWMSYTRTNSYMSSDESESEDEEMWDELQELREK